MKTIPPTPEMVDIFRPCWKYGGPSTSHLSPPNTPPRGHISSNQLQYSNPFQSRLQIDGQARSVRDQGRKTGKLAVISIWPISTTRGTVYSFIRKIVFSRRTPPVLLSIRTRVWSQVFHVSIFLFSIRWLISEKGRNWTWQALSTKVLERNHMPLFAPSYPLPTRTYVSYLNCMALALSDIVYSPL